MSINRVENIGENNINPYSDYVVRESSALTANQEYAIERSQKGYQDSLGYTDYTWSQPYSIPILVVKSK